MCVCLRFLQACGRRGLPREGGGRVSLGTGGRHSRVLPEGQQYIRSSGLQRRVHDVWCQGLRKGPCSKFSHVSLCYFKDREHSIRIPRDHSKGWMSYCVLILTLHFTGTMCSKLISRSVVFIVYSLYIHDIHKAHMMFRNAEIKQLTKQSLLS